MADSPAERQRRARAHKRGDHSSCDPSRCRDRGRDPVTGPAVTRRPVTTEAVADVTPAPSAEPERIPAGIEAAVKAYIKSLPYTAGDPRALLGEVAIQLARRVDETGALPAAVRELRVLLVQLAEVPNGPSGFVDEVRVRRAQRRLDALISAAA